MTKRRDGLGRIMESIDMDYMLNTNELESYRDYKINRDNILFPDHNDDQCGEVITYSIDKLNNNK